MSEVYKVSTNSSLFKVMTSLATAMLIICTDRNATILSECNIDRRLFRDKIINRGSYMSAHVLLNLLNELGKRDKMRGLPSILSLFRNEFNKFNNTRAQMLDSIYHMTLRLL